MSRTSTPAYVVKMAGFGQMAWPYRDAGRPTDANLAKFVAGFEASTEAGGVNAHLGPQLIARATIARNTGYDGETVATYTGPLFRAVGGTL